jgi:mannose-6-phosphate isomerase-like protein (cupin superfamily)
MEKVANIIADAIAALPEIRSARVHETDMVLGAFDGCGYNLTYMQANDKNVAHHHETYDATLCFVSGAGKVLVNDAFLEYGKGSWFKVPWTTKHQILPDTDTLMLTIQNPATTFSEKGWGDIVFDEKLF